MHIHTNCICKSTFVVFAEKVIYHVLFALLSFYIYIFMYIVHIDLYVKIILFLVSDFVIRISLITYKHSSKTHGDTVSKVHYVSHLRKSTFLVFK